MGFETATLQNIATGLQTVGAVTSTVGAYNKSVAEKQGYEYQSQIARNNSQLAGWQADDARNRGEREEQNHRMKVAALRGTQRATLAARGIDLGEGSALNILTDTDFMGERDALLIRDNAAKEVWGFQEQGRNFKHTADMYSARAKMENPFMSAGSTLLTGAGAVARSWYAMRAKTDGVFNSPGGNAFGYGEV